MMSDTEEEEASVILEEDLSEIKSTPRQGCRPTWTNSCRLLQCCNTMMICVLIALVVYEYEKVETLQSQVVDEQNEITELKKEVREKQQFQIQELHEEVIQEQDLTIYILAGVLSLLTCLISMFHMSTHLQKMNQPLIQRKIVSILWMSPIYSVTSFLSLIYPPSEGYCAIVKDFYESYCIYNFLSFLIAVLGHGDRDQAAEVLAKHASHLDRPARLLSRWYDPPPETSDKAKANAVITECQILAMQFVFIRPLTTIMYVIYNSIQERNNEATGEETSLAANATMIVANNLTRWLEDDWQDKVDYSGSDTNETYFPYAAPTSAPIISSPFETLAPGDYFENNTAVPGTDQHDEFKEATINYFKSFSFALAMVVNISICFAFAGLLKFYHAVREDLQWCRPWPKFLTIKGVVFLTFWQGLAILIFTYLNSSPNSEDPYEKGRRIQNVLICFEMLLFSLTHWCVFPAEEWEKDYTPPEKVNKPGLGLQDFVSDVAYLAQNRRSSRIARRRRRGRRAPDHGSLYHDPDAATVVASGPVVSSSRLYDYGGDMYDESSQTTPHLFFADGEMVNHTPARARGLSGGEADDEDDDDIMEML